MRHCGWPGFVGGIAWPAPQATISQPAATMIDSPARTSRGSRIPRPRSMARWPLSLTLSPLRGARGPDPLRGLGRRGQDRGQLLGDARLDQVRERGHQEPEAEIDPHARRFQHDARIEALARHRQLVVALPGAGRAVFGRQLAGRLADALLGLVGRERVRDIELVLGHRVLRYSFSSGLATPVGAFRSYVNRATSSWFIANLMMVPSPCNSGCFWNRW